MKNHIPALAIAGLFATLAANAIGDEFRHAPIRTTFQGGDMYVNNDGSVTVGDVTGYRRYDFMAGTVSAISGLGRFGAAVNPVAYTALDAEARRRYSAIQAEACAAAGGRKFYKRACAPE